MIAPPAWVRSYLGIPYAKADCYELGRLVWRQERGRELPLYAYEHTADLDAWAEGVREQVAATVIIEREAPRWQRIDKPEAFAFGLYRVMGNRWHLMTCVGDQWALNTNLRLGSHCTRLDTYWERHLDGYYLPA